ncbi:sugar porter family MFS transporter [Corynebacterium sp. 3HC-13]|uniref:sugar porter family MFS transporter n=1 Tax=Corynebacterium poyangense TaxID=2684405 RepID=UPI001CC99813|nr:sugar porter family MFS transporter [Corynebacterium poyangense]MBZ8178209.1 sugar porter family MFS transporter [Corynebacterium poyangense]
MESQTQQSRYVRTVSSVAALGGLLFGYDTGVMSGALLYITPEFHMTPTQEGRVTAMLLVGAAIGALLGGRIAEMLGRRLSLIVAAGVFILGSLWCALSSSVFMLASARTFLGVAVGAVSIVAPMYIAEMVPARVRGRLVSLNTLMIVVGQLVAYLVNSVLASSGNWHLMLGMAAIPGAMLGIGMVLLPDTPYWYARHNRVDRAHEVANRAGMHLSEFLDAKEEQGPSRRKEWRALQQRWLLITVMIAIGVGITQQISGVNAVIYFAPTMMSQVGISTTNSVYTAILIGVVSVVACWIGLKIVDRVGRRRLLTIGLSGNVISLILVAIMFRHATESTAMAYLCLALMALFVAFQQSAVSLTTWLLMSEIVPVQVRSIGMGMAGLMLWIANWFVAQFFLPMVDALSATGAFGVFAVLGALSLVFVRIFVPETTGRSLEEVSEGFRRRWS